MSQHIWALLEGAIDAESAVSEPLKKLLRAVGAAEARVAIAFVIYERGAPAVSPSHAVLGEPVLYAAESGGEMRYIGVTKELKSRVRVAAGCASHEHLGELVESAPDLVVYAIPTPLARHRWYDAAYIGLFQNVQNRAGNPQVADARHTGRIRLVLTRIYEQPGIVKTAAIGGMWSGFGEQILKQLLEAGWIHSVQDPCSPKANPTVRYHPGRAPGACTWRVGIVTAEASRTLHAWMMFEVPFDGAASPWTCHLVGWRAEGGKGQVTSALSMLDLVNRKAVTRSGRIYALGSKAGANVDAMVTWGTWRMRYGVEQEREITDLFTLLLGA